MEVDRAESKGDDATKIENGSKFLHDDGMILSYEGYPRGLEALALKILSHTESIEAEGRDWTSGKSGWERCRMNRKKGRNEDASEDSLEGHNRWERIQCESCRNDWETRNYCEADRGKRMENSRRTVDSRTR